MHRALPWLAPAAAAVAVHVVVLGARILPEPQPPLEVVAFELVEAPAPEPLPPEPEPEPEPPPPEPPVSNRPDDPTPDEEVPLVTGLPLTPDQLLADGGMGVRVGNTAAPGYDADVAPEDLRGFAGGVEEAAPPPPDLRPELLRSYKPRYPEHLVQEGVQGRVLLEVQVLTNGRAGEVGLVRGVHPDLDRLAMQSMRRFRWRPARKDGAKVEATIIIAIRFQIEE